MRFRVTGGQDGISGIDVAEKRYNAGDEVELTAKQSEWLLEQGYVETLDAAKKTKSAAPIIESPVAAEPSDDSGDI